MNHERLKTLEWEVLEEEKPGYLGADKDNYIQELNLRYGKDNWRFAWKLKDGKVVNYMGIFGLFIKSYMKYFEDNPGIAESVSRNFSYVCDKDFILEEEAFDPYCLYLVPGHDNQIHHVAINLSLIILGYSFSGNRAGQAREGKELYFLSPGRIDCFCPELIPDIQVNNYSSDVSKTSIENLYQSAKVIQIRS